MGVNQARHQFDPKLIQANPNPAGNPAHFDRMGSGQVKKIQIASELALGLSVPVSSGVITDLEVTYDPRKYDSRKTLNFIGFFDNPPAAGRYDYSQAYESIKFSPAFSINAGLRFKMNDCHEVFARLGVRQTKMTYQSRLYHRGNLLAVSSDKKTIFQYSTEMGWLYHWSKAISSEASIGYRFGKVKKISDIHPQTGVDYFPKIKLRQGSARYGIRYTF